MLIKILICISFQSMLCSCALENNQKFLPTTQEATGSYLIKYLTPDTEYPVELIDYSQDPKTKWFKYGSQGYVDELDAFGPIFSLNNSKKGNNLVLRNYNQKVLDHYETQPLFDESMLSIDDGFDGDAIYDALENSDVYTTVSLESFDLVERVISPHSSSISCKCKLLMAIGLNLEHTHILTDIIDQTVKISVNLKEVNKKKHIERKTRVKRHQGNSVARRRGNSGGLRKIEKGGEFNTRNMDASLFVIHVTEGPFIVPKEKNLSLNITCKMLLIDYDNKTAFNKKISLVVGKDRQTQANGGSTTSAMNSLQYSFLVLLNVFLFKLMC